MYPSCRNYKITSFALPFHSLYPTCSIQKLLQRISFSWLYVHFTQTIVLTNLSNSMIIYLKIGGSDESKVAAWLCFPCSPVGGSRACAPTSLSLEAELLFLNHLATTIAFSKCSQNPLSLCEGKFLSLCRGLKANTSKGSGAIGDVVLVRVGVVLLEEVCHGVEGFWGLI